MDSDNDANTGPRHEATRSVYHNVDAARHDRTDRANNTTSCLLEATWICDASRVERSLITRSSIEGLMMLGHGAQCMAVP